MSFKEWTPHQVEAHNARVQASKAAFGDKVAAPLQQGYAEAFPKEVMCSGKRNDSTNVNAAGGACRDENTPQIKTFTIPIEPVPAPRMTRRDKWIKPRRPCVQRYFDYREQLQRAVGDIPVVPDEIQCRFFIPMPDSWTKKKRRQMDGKPHRTRPDRDNMDKAVCDALFLEDGGVWKGSQEKRWAVNGSVEITMVWKVHRHHRPLRRNP